MAHFGDLANEIYLRGLAGERPDLPMTADGLEAAARDVLPAEAFSYVAGGASTERTIAANREAFARWRIVPRMLRGITERDLSTTVLGTSMAAPVLTAPVGVLGLVHPDADLAVTRAAAALGLTSVLSTLSSTTLEEAAAAAADAPRWFQLYWPRDPEVAESLVRRAGVAGYRAIVVTVDTWSVGWRPRDLQLAHLPFMRATGIANYLSDPVFRAQLDTPPEESAQAMQLAVRRWVELFGNPTLGWSDLSLLRQWTRVPVLVKGICHPDDARAALDHGADGLVVSNHGGRQVDGARAALDCLPGVLATVGGRAPVLLDSGIRCGADVLIALALGARAVLLGRPWIYGLGLAGQRGVEHVLRVLLGDLDLALALAGYASPSELGARSVVRERIG
ncbi:MAG TPA: alpha-hydroxy-acid oxidizing protein [Pseudonocardiaceae bacterium]|jgi:isopentenyl diphosphate isomerase/L-lactate dehydrogenase-like FMN-dependent dehydrogenase|nr:alpha-hydroxy-acid oxidizing protein [Pseudonocardiaceae bacterium]